ncbi:MAG: alpha/beta hydrolase, partial [Paraglaciecola sp.]|nr:alpha/beta hydrolase [Paraglaciecola sp.]
MFTFLLKKIGLHTAKQQTLFALVLVANLVFQLFANNLVFAQARQSSTEQQLGQAEAQFTVTVRGQGKPIILIPGLMSDARVWDSLVAELAPHYELHLLNVAGFADNAAVASPSMPALKKQLLAYIAEHNLDKPAVIGHSLGGFMAFWLASSEPALVGPIVSVDGLPYIGPIFTGSNSSTFATMAAQAQQIKGMYANLTEEQLAAQSRYGLPRQASSAESQAKIMAMLEHSNPATVADAVYTLLSTDLRQDIGNISSPVLLL